jgi:hypothetical protein
VLRAVSLPLAIPSRYELLPIYLLFEPPTVDGLAIETPVATNLESGDTLLLEQTVDGRGMDSQIISELSHCENWTSKRRPTSSNAAILYIGWNHNIIALLLCFYDAEPFCLMGVRRLL